MGRGRTCELEKPAGRVAGSMGRALRGGGKHKVRRVVGGGGGRMNLRRMLDALIITSVGALCTAFVLDNLVLGVGAAIVGGAAAILDDIIRDL